MSGHANPVLVATGVISLGAWLYLLLLHGRFWIVRIQEEQQSVSVRTAYVIAAVIPARNEAEVIARAVSSLLQQQLDCTLHIIVVDDNSADGTAQVAGNAGTDLPSRRTMTIISGTPLPPGWSGKLWAVQQGLERAAALRPDFFLLTDADVEHGPQSLARLVAIAEAAQYDLASYMVRLPCETFPEKLLIPAFVFFFFMLYPPAWIRDPKRRMAGAAGGCILIRPEALAQAGGIMTIRSEIIDDCALAKAVKQCGGRVWLGTSRTTRAVRSYGSFAEVERMIARTAFHQLHHSVWLLAGSIIGLALIFLLPVALLFSGNWLLVSLGGVAFLLMTGTFLPMTRLYHRNLLWACTLPVATVFYCVATLHSAWKYWTGRGGEWKGRAQDVPGVPER